MTKNRIKHLHWGLYLKEGRGFLFLIPNVLFIVNSVRFQRTGNRKADRWSHRLIFYDVYEWNENVYITLHLMVETIDKVLL